MYQLLALLLLCGTTPAYSRKRSDHYVVPEATIEILEPTGFTVSIPDNGITLFAFHGNINSPIEDLAAGEYSKDILKPKNGQWTFEDRNRKLNPGDVINYWTYAIKNGLGYRRDFQTYTVPNNKDNISTTEVSLTPADTTDLTQLNQVLKNLLKQFQNIINKTDELQHRVDSLEETVSTNLNITDIQTKLILIGSPMPDSTAIQTLQNVINERLQLPDIARRIHSATQTKAGIIFDVEKPLDKLRLLAKVNKLPKDSNILIIDYIVETPNDLENANPVIDLRNNFNVTDDETT